MLPPKIKPNNSLCPQVSDCKLYVVNSPSATLITVMIRMPVRIEIQLCFKLLISNSSAGCLVSLSNFRWFFLVFEDKVYS